MIKSNEKRNGWVVIALLNALVHWDCKIRSGLLFIHLYLLDYSSAALAGL